MANGICKLTGLRGTFIKAHLIPKALTRPATKGLPFIQSGYGVRPAKRWSSWYDDRLVSQAGEDVLTRHDTWAINELRKHKLVWSGWGPMQNLAGQHEVIPGTTWGFRKIDGLDTRRLRLFFLCLLWRAAATDRKEFSEIVLKSNDLEILRKMVLEQNPYPISFYPIQLTQLSTLGEPHNLTPIVQTKTIPPFDDVPEQIIPIFRFYFDGLIAHISRDAPNEELTRKLGPLVVGEDDHFVVSTVTFEESFQLENMIRIISATSTALAKN